MTPNSPSSPHAERRDGARAEAQRGRILDAAQRCFIEHGFHAAPISQIAGEAGISQGLMYRYFDNKRAMVLALIERQLAADQQSIGQTAPSMDMVDGLLLAYGHWARGESLGGHDTAISSVALYAEITAEAQRDPVVAEVTPSGPFVPNPGEVHSVFEVPLSRILAHETYGRFRISRGGKEHSTWQIDHDGHVIWGITANLTRLFRDRVMGEVAA